MDICYSDDMHVSQGLCNVVTTCVLIVGVGVGETVKQMKHLHRLVVHPHNCNQVNDSFCTCHT